jgi:Fe2+ transport system protein FeoA
MSNLAEVGLHRPVTVVAVAGERTFRRRLLEMGLVPGTVVTVVNVAPFGDPLELSLRNGRWSIRKQEAAAITVRP